MEDGMKRCSDIDFVMQSIHVISASDPVGLSQDCARH